MPSIQSDRVPRLEFIGAMTMAAMLLVAAVRAVSGQEFQRLCWLVLRMSPGWVAAGSPVDDEAALTEVESSAHRIQLVVLQRARGLCGVLGSILDLAHWPVSLNEALAMHLAVEFLCRWCATSGSNENL